MAQRFRFLLRFLCQSRTIFRVFLLKHTRHAVEVMVAMDENKSVFSSAQKEITHFLTRMYLHIFKIGQEITTVPSQIRQCEQMPSLTFHD